MMYILPTVVEFVHATVCFVQCTLYTVSKHSYSSSVFIFGNFDDLFFWFLEPFTQRIKLHTVYTHVHISELERFSSRAKNQIFPTSLDVRGQEQLRIRLRAVMSDLVLLKF